MTTSFALDLSLDGVGLMAKTDGGWAPVGRVSLSEPDFADKLDAIRRSVGGDAPLSADLIIPNAQILYTRLPAAATDAAIAAKLEAETPYRRDELAWIKVPDGAGVRLAATTRQTLAEARTFAVEHGFVPARIVAWPQADGFPAEIAIEAAPPDEASSESDEAVEARSVAPAAPPEPQAAKPELGSLALATIAPPASTPHPRFAESDGLSEEEALTLFGKRGKANSRTPLIWLAAGLVGVAVAVGGLWSASDLSTPSLGLATSSAPAMDDGRLEDTGAPRPEAAGGPEGAPEPSRSASVEDIAPEEEADAAPARKRAGSARTSSAEPGPAEGVQLASVDPAIEVTPSPPARSAQTESHAQANAPAGPEAEPEPATDEVASVPPDLDYIVRDATPPLRPPQRPLAIVEAAAAQDSSDAGARPGAGETVVAAVAHDGGDGTAPTAGPVVAAEAEDADATPESEAPAAEPAAESDLAQESGPTQEATAAIAPVDIRRPMPRPAPEAERIEAEVDLLRPRPRPAQEDALLHEVVPLPPERPSDFAGLARQAQQQSSSASAGGGVAEASTAAVTAQAPAATRQSFKPPMPTKKTVAKQATSENVIRLSQINLIGVYGSPLQRRALVRLPSGRYVKVKVGDRFDGGRIAAIDASRLRYVKNGRDIVLSLPKT